MAQPAPELPPRLADSDPPIDPTAIDRAYLEARARRRARIEHRRTARRASSRFWVVLLVLVVGTAVLALTIWREVQDLFGL
jgi:hypothetical protein